MAKTAVPAPVFSEEYELLRNVVVRARQRAGLTQAELARRVRCSPAHIALVETGQIRVELIEFFELLSGLGLDSPTVAEDLFQAFLALRDMTPSPESGCG